MQVLMFFAALQLRVPFVWYSLKHHIPEQNVHYLHFHGSIGHRGRLFKDPSTFERHHVASKVSYSSSGKRFFTCPKRPEQLWTNPTPYSRQTGMNLTSHLHLLLRLRIHGTKPLLPYASMACTRTTLPLPFTKQFYSISPCMVQYSIL